MKAYFLTLSFVSLAATAQTPSQKPSVPPVPEKAKEQASQTPALQNNSQASNSSTSPDRNADKNEGLPPQSIYPANTSSSSSSSPSSSVSSEEADVGFLSPLMLAVPEGAEVLALLPEDKLKRFQSQIELLEELVNISSDTTEHEGVNKVQSIVARELKKLKFKVDEIANPDPFTKSGKLLVATFPGKSEQFITLVAHADTVFPKESGFTGFERNDLEAKGPGVIDDKGGLVVGLEALRVYLKENPTPAYSLRFVVSPSEEIGSTGFLSLFEQMSLNSIAVLGLEPALDQGDIVTSRRGDRWYEVKIKGREAHAGRAHKEGINACHELAIKIEKLQKLTNYKRDVTISVGAIKGGKDKFAIVCGEATMKLDVRFSDTKNRTRILNAVEAILNTQYVKAKSDGAMAVTEWKIVDDPKPFPEEKKAATLVEIYKKVISDLEGYKVSARKSGGTSDLNFFYRPGLIVIDGLGPIGSGMHTHEEKIVLKSLLTRSEALAKLIQAASL